MYREACQTYFRDEYRWAMPTDRIEVFSPIYRRQIIETRCYGSKSFRAGNIKLRMLLQHKQICLFYLLIRLAATIVAGG